MRVTLVGIMKFNDRLIYEMDWFNDVPSESELIASIAMRSTRTTDSLFSLLKESGEDITARRMREAIEMGHYTVPGFTDFIFMIEDISRACSHQLVRHRTAWYLQQSQRTVDPTDREDWYVIPPEIAESPEALEIYENQMDDIRCAYDRMVLFEDISREDARFILPNATKTRIFMKIDGSNLLHFFELRLSDHAQWEIKELAERIHAEVIKECPNIFDLELEGYWW